MLNEEGTDFIREPAYEPPCRKKYFGKEMMFKYYPLKKAQDAVERKKAKGKQPTEEEEEALKAAMADYSDMNFKWCSNWDGKKYDIVFYGVSGYTGYLMAQYLLRTALKKTKEKFTFAFAGRTPAKVQKVIDKEFGGTEWANTPVIQAAFDDVPSIIDMVKSAHVVVNVAGPYMATQGEILVDACVWLKAHYVDISGEIPWSKRLLDLHKHAQEAGVHICAS